MDSLTQKLKDLPAQAGVYYHLNAKRQIIYVGKAASLKHRVRHYFQKNQITDHNLKMRQLISQIADVKWTVTNDALQALFLESEMIKRYQPKYNVLERNVSSSSWLYVCANLKAPNPYLVLSRDLTQTEGLTICGPYLDGRALKRALKYLRKSFPFSSHKTLPRQACLDYHLGLCPGPETADFELKAALADLRKLLALLQGRQSQTVQQLARQMQQAADAYEYETAAKIRNQLEVLRSLRASLIFTDFDHLKSLSQEQALADLQALFQLKQPSLRIEAYDISHISGQYTTASMIVALSGVLRPELGRRFKAALSGNNDFAQIEAVMRRRFKSAGLKKSRPDLILIDGGKGQVSAVLKVLHEFNLAIPVLGLAKKQEQLIFKTSLLKLDSAKVAQLGGRVTQIANFTTLSLPLNTPLIKFMQRLRDAAHRRALVYHNYLQAKDQTASSLLSLPGIGKITYRKLMKHFGTVARLKQAPPSELRKVVSKSQAETIKRYFQRA